MTQTVKQMYLQTFDYTWDRLRHRLEGLTDEEYFWEPVPGCLSVRPTETGAYHMDPAAPPSAQTGPVTTIAWRMCHIAGGVLMGFAGSLLSGRPPDLEIEDWPGGSEAAILFLDRACQIWREALDSIPEEDMWKSLGSAWGAYGEDSMADLVLHVFDEFVHHGAEVALMRDLFRHRDQLSA